MAKKIELDLPLKGTDAREFHKYMEHPDDTEAGRELIREALQLSNRNRSSSEICVFLLTGSPFQY